MRWQRYDSVIRGEDPSLSAHVFRWVLSLASVPYRMVVGLRNCAFNLGWKQIHKVDAPVISVGNLTVGGTGKTPFVEWLSRKLSDDWDRSVCIVSRGYGATDGWNDEAMVLEENLPDVPHLQNADRVQGARTAREELQAEVIVLDDGFQHRRLHRDLDIVLVDASRPLSQESILPRGLLREPTSSLKRASAVILTRCDQAPPGETAASQKSWLQKRFPHLRIALATHRPTTLCATGESSESIESLQGTTVAAFCGLGNPDAFRQTLVQLGARIDRFRTYPDHHAYSREDVAELHRWASDLPTEGMILTTQKDWVKLRIDILGDRPLRALKVEMHMMEGEAAITELLDQTLTRWVSSEATIEDHPANED